MLMNPSSPLSLNVMKQIDQEMEQKQTIAKLVKFKSKQVHTYIPSLVRTVLEQGVGLLLFIDE